MHDTSRTIAHNFVLTSAAAGVCRPYPTAFARPAVHTPTAPVVPAELHAGVICKQTCQHTMWVAWPCFTFLTVANNFVRTLTAPHLRLPRPPHRQPKTAILDVGKSIAEV